MSASPSSGSIDTISSSVATASSPSPLAAATLAAIFSIALRSDSVMSAPRDFFMESISVETSGYAPRSTMTFAARSARSGPDGGVARIARP